MNALLIPSLVAAALIVSTSAEASWTVTFLAPTTATASQVVGMEGAVAAGGVQVGSSVTNGYWSTPSNAYVGLGGGSFGVEGIGGGLLVGSGFVSGVVGAAYYSLATQTFTSVHPGAAFPRGSSLHGASPNTQVGQAVSSVTSNAALWRGTAASFVNLHPSVASFSEAWAATDSLQVGMVSIGSRTSVAALWRGTAASFVDLSGGARSSIAYGAHGETQVGSRSLGTNAGLAHAALWSGTAESFVDLHPLAATSPVDSSQALAAYEGYQVGFSSIAGSAAHAGLWEGTAASFLDLHQFLPSNYRTSFATSISSDGAFIYVGGYALNPVTSRNQAIVWSSPVLVPEPATWLTFGLGLLVLLRRRKPH